MSTNQRFDIGTTFTTRNGKSWRACKVVDVLKTYNRAGELVEIRYVATHEFCGQTVTDRNVCDTTIARNLIHAVAPV